MMDSDIQKLLSTLSFKLVAEATLKIQELGLKTSAIIPFIILMLETVLSILENNKRDNIAFAKNNPEDFVDSAIAQVLTMFSLAFGKEMLAYVDHEKKSEEEIKKEVDDFLSKNKLDWGDNERTRNETKD